MRPLVNMDTIQIEVTNYCPNSCSNCTRLCGHHEKPYFMPLEEVKKAIDSMVGFERMVGIMGGEPLCHPQFGEICAYLRSVFPKEQCGLWTTFPKGKEHHRAAIVETFGNIFLNDHTREDVLHGPILVEATKVFPDKFKRDYLIDDCWVQKYWSAAINPHGAFFCEVAAALSMVLDKESPSEAWKVEPRWWEKNPIDFIEQQKKYCDLCGAAMPLKKRFSVERVDDISEAWVERLKETSPKIKRKEYVINSGEVVIDRRQTATYKDMAYRQKTADRYGIFITLNKTGFCTPHLKSNWEGATDGS